MQKISKKQEEVLTLPYIGDSENTYLSGDEARDQMRLKLIKVMQTPPKSFPVEFKYEK